LARPVLRRSVFTRTFNRGSIARPRVSSECAHVYVNVSVQ
jgi:hypothetical protein